MPKIKFKFPVYAFSLNVVFHPMEYMKNEIIFQKITQIEVSIILFPQTIKHVSMGIEWKYEYRVNTFKLTYIMTDVLFGWISLYVLDVHVELLLYFLCPDLHKFNIILEQRHKTL